MTQGSATPSVVSAIFVGGRYGIISKAAPPRATLTPPIMRSLALRPAHSRGHQVVTAIRRLQPFRYLHDCSDCFRLERIAGSALHPLIWGIGVKRKFSASRTAFLRKL